jgi:RNA polymerase sigma-70 factor (ECF subfamily)
MTNNPDEYGDIAQEIFIKVYKNLDKYSPEYHFSTWIIRITTNHVIDLRRKKRIETSPIDEVDFTLTTNRSAEDEYISDENVRELNRLIGELPEMYRIPIVLYHRHGMSYKDIADSLNMPLSKVKNRIFRGRRLLKDELVKQKELD